MKKFERKAQSQRKHGPPSVSSASKAPAAPPTHRPEWKGPGYVPKVRRKQPPSIPKSSPRDIEQLVPQELQQLVLDIYRETFPVSNDFEELKPTLREIKDAVALGNFEQAFGTEENRVKYTIRWSPSKALACSNILAFVYSELEEEYANLVKRDQDHRSVNVLSFGQAPAGLMAFAALIKHQSSKLVTASPPGLDGNSEINPRWNIHLIDAVDWSHVVSSLHHSLTQPRPLSKYASAKARASNTPPLTHDALSWDFRHLSIADCETETLRAMMGSFPTLIALLFTLGGLYTSSMSQATVFLQSLTASAPKGSLLVIMDDHTHPGKEEGMYLGKLIYEALTPQGQQEELGRVHEESKAWEKLAEYDENVFRIRKGLWFPVSLENIKCQIHLLKRL
jgi:25S rRNA (uracil2843-N3)-methyltransferase